MIRSFFMFIVYGLLCLYLYNIDKAIYLAAVIDNARENYANGRPIRWACTPTAAAEQKLELLFNGN